MHMASTSQTDTQPGFIALSICEPWEMPFQMRDDSYATSPCQLNPKLLTLDFLHKLMSFNPETTLPLIVCPQSHATLVHEGDTLVSTNAETRLQYPIRDGIPVLLVDEANTLSVEEWADIMQRNGRDVNNPSNNGHQE